jgi:hypothetical protein
MNRNFPTSDPVLMNLPKFAKAIPVPWFRFGFWLVAPASMVMFWGLCTVDISIFG